MNHGRLLKNKTGIDISVAGHDAAPSARQVKDYHVVVITRLPHFKRAEHSEDDVVQFMVGGWSSPLCYCAAVKCEILLVVLISCKEC